MVAKRHKITNVPQFLKQRDINSYYSVDVSLFKAPRRCKAREFIFQDFNFTAISLPIRHQILHHSFSFRVKDLHEFTLASLFNKPGLTL